MIIANVYSYLELLENYKKTFGKELPTRAKVEIERALADLMFTQNVSDCYLDADMPRIIKKRSISVKVFTSVSLRIKKAIQLHIKRREKYAST